MAVQTEEHYNAGDLRARKEAAGSKAATALAQLTGMAGQMGSAPRTIADTVGNQRSEGLKSLSDRSTELRSQYYPEIFRQLSTIGTGAADMSPEAALATSIASYNRAGGAYNQANDLIRNYQGTTEQLGNQAMQGLQAQYSALGDVSNQQRATEGNLADRIYRGEQLNEQQRQFDTQMNMENQKLAAARAASGGSGISGNGMTANNAPPPNSGLLQDKNGDWVDGKGQKYGFDTETGQWVVLGQGSAQNPGGFNLTEGVIGALGGRGNIGTQTANIVDAFKYHPANIIPGGIGGNAGGVVGAGTRNPILNNLANAYSAGGQGLIF